METVKKLSVARGYGEKKQLVPIDLHKQCCHKTSLYKNTTSTKHNKMRYACILTQFSSVAQSCPTLCDPMDYSTPDLPVHHQLLEFTKTHVH